MSYGVGEAIVDTSDGEVLIANVLYTPEVTLNILSMKELEAQGYMITYGTNRCKIGYMFDLVEKRGKEGSLIQEQDERDIITSHNRFLDDYFKSLDSEEECSLIKGLEDLNMDRQEEHDYIDQEYMSLNGTLYAMKVNTFPRFIAFLNLIKVNGLVFENWEILSKRFLELLEWFYLEFMRQSTLGILPPTIGVIKVDMLGLYKFVDELGGYMNVTLNNQWYQVARLLGLADEKQEELKECYKEYIGLVKIYYEDALRANLGMAESEGDSKGVADIKPQPDADLEEAMEEMDESPKKRIKIEKNEVMKEGNNTSESSDDFVIIV